MGGDNAAVIWCSNRRKLEEEEHRLSLWQRQLPASLCPQVFRFIFLYTYIHFFTAYIYTFD